MVLAREWHHEWNEEESYEQSEYAINKSDELTSMPVSWMKIDSSYQPPHTESRVRSIIEGFDNNLLQAITVNVRAGGSIYVIDGQHRLLAAQKLQLPTMKAWVHRNLTQQQEADMFYQLGTKRRSYLTQVARFNAAVTAGYKKESDINDVLRKLGLHVGASSGKSVNAIGAVAGLFYIYDHFRAAGLHETLHTLIRTYPEEKGRFLSPLPESLAMFLHVYTDASRNYLEKQLAKKAPKTLVRLIRNSDIERRGLEIMRTDIGRASTAESGMYVIRSIYNYGLRSKRLLD